MTRRTPFLAFFLLLTLPAFFAQTPLRRENLQAQTPSWQAVIGGEAVSPCIETSYGVALLSDGRLLSACTSAGTVIWQRSIKGRPSPYLSAFGDFLYVVTDRTHLNLVNPSGMTLWTAIAPFEITDFPLVGRDGRVFVKGKKGIACYGLNGTRKWQVETDELGSLPFGVLVLSSTAPSRFGSDASRNWTERLNSSARSTAASSSRPASKMPGVQA